jgi:hypothetical protein
MRTISIASGAQPRYPDFATVGARERRSVSGLHPCRLLLRPY